MATLSFQKYSRWQPYNPNFFQEKNAGFFSEWFFCSLTRIKLLLERVAFTLSRFSLILNPFWYSSFVVEVNHFPQTHVMGRFRVDSSPLSLRKPLSNTKSQLEGQLHGRLRHWLVMAHIQLARMVPWEKAPVQSGRKVRRLTFSL